MKHPLWLFMAAFLPALGFGQYAITTTDLFVGTANQPYASVIQTNSSIPASACNLLSGTLPPGLALQLSGSACVVAGTPTVADNRTFSMSITNTQGQTTPSKTFSLVVFGVTTGVLPTAAVNFPYNFTLQANGGGAYQWSLSSGSLPTGISLSSSGLLSGTPQASGVFSFTVRVVDLQLNLTNTRTFSLTVSSSTPVGQFQIISASLPGAGVNQAYSATIQTTGASGNLNGQNGCLITQGLLPAGIFITPSGTSCLLSGQTANQGTYQIQVQAMDSLGNTTAPVTFFLTVGSGGGSSGSLSIITSQVPDGSTGTPYAPNGSTFTFAATGTGSVNTWQLDNGSLPSGLTLNSNGSLTGTPRQAGSYSFTVRLIATSGLSSQTATRSFVMTIASGALIIVETAIPAATTSQPYTFTLHANGGSAPYRWRLASATNIAGFAIDLNSGVITGTPVASGTYTLAVTVTDAVQSQSTLAYTLEVAPPFQITTSSLPDVSTTLGYTQTLQASGGTAPYGWSLSGGSLPPGLTLSQNGVINGAPTTNGLYAFTVVATDAIGRTTSKTLTIQVGPPSPVIILTSSLPDGAVGTAYSQTLNASGGQSPYTWTLVGGSLPSGLSLSAGGVVQGTPGQGGTYSFTVQAKDAQGNSAVHGYSIAVASSVLTTSPSVLTFTYAIGSTAPTPAQVSITSTTPVSFTASSNISWLSVSPSSATTPATLTVSVNPSGLAAGFYTGFISLTPAGGVGPSQSISVTLNVSGASSFAVSPGALSFSYSLNGGTSAPQTLSVTGSEGTIFTTNTSASWLIVTPQNAASPTNLTVSINPVNLPAGTYNAFVNIVGGGGIRQIPVTLTVSVVGSPLLTLSKSSLTFTYQVGAAFPTTQFVTLLSVFPVSFSATSDSPWLSVTSNVGTTPATLFVSVNPQGLAAANYTGTVVITTTSGAGNSTLTLPVTFTVSSPGSPSISTVVNGASYTPGPFSPGEVVAIGGSALGPTTPLNLALDSTGKVATTLGGVQVLFNGFPAPLIYVSSTQINAVVPYEVAGQFSLFIAVRYQGQTSVAYQTNTTATAPALFTANASGTGPAAVANQDGSPNGPARPARKGDVIALYVTGEGSTQPVGVTGKVTTVSQTGPLTPQPILPVTVTIGGLPVPIVFYGEAPGIVSGVMQVNVRIPLNSLSGDLPVEVSVGTNRSQAGVTVSVQ